MKHLLLTRYNVPINFKSRSPQRNPLDPDYLDGRDALFRRFCVPSVAQQTCMDFQWVVFFHPETPVKYYDFLSGIAVVHLTDSTDECVRFARELGDQNGLTITTRLDNDDAVADTFVASVQKASREYRSTAPYVVTFPIGAVTSLQRGRFYKKRDVGNPFLTLAEPEGVRHTVWSFSHGQMTQSYPVEQIVTRDPMWLAVVHETNVINQRMRWPWFWQTRPNTQLAAHFPGFGDEG
jgi:Putative rhamnosyl transferase